MCKLSIIVPVYNTGENIRKCITSLLSQNLKEIEILLINDGSTDNTEEIINEYLEKEANAITYIKKENTGVADTRNFGISKAKGKYILFVDADDYIKNDLVEKLYTYMEQDLDIIKFKLKKVNTKGEELEKVGGTVFSKIDGQEAFNKLCFSDVLLDSPCV